MSPTEDRKEEHIDISLSMDVESAKGCTGFQDVHLVHQAFCELDLLDVKVETTFLGRAVSLPLIIVSMTGGSKQALKLNKTLAEVAEKLCLPMGVGSIRAGIENESLLESFRVVRRSAPSVPIISNIGATQIGKHGAQVAVKAVELLEADALAVHLNRLQEAVMPEGEPSQRGFVKALEACIEELSVPLILKETGAGFSLEAAELCKSLGVTYVDVGGRGGTNFVKVEKYRAVRRRDRRKIQLGQTFTTWGIPTAASLVEALSVGGLHVIATGGLRTGLEAAKALALGAEMVGVGLPLLKQARKGEADVSSWIEDFAQSLRCAMFLAGGGDLSELRNVPVMLLGFTGAWLQARGIDIGRFSRRRWK